jgi:hypothetical protein
MPPLTLEAQIVYQSGRGGSGFVCQIPAKRYFKNAQDSSIKIFKVPMTEHDFVLADGTSVALVVLWRYDTPSATTVEKWQSALEQAVAQFVAAGKTQNPPSLYGDGIGSMGDMAVRTGLDMREDGGAAIQARLKELGAMDYLPMLSV